MVLGIFEIALRLRYRHVFMWHSLEILNVFNTSTLKQIFWKTQTLFEKLECGFLAEITWMKTQHFHTNLLCQMPMLRHIEWGVQNEPITKNRVLPLTTLFLQKFYIFFSQMSTFTLFESIEVLFESCFSLWASLKCIFCMKTRVWVKGPTWNTIQPFMYFR